MERKNNSLIIITCSLVLLFLSACAAPGINLVKSGDVAVDVLPSKSFDLDNVRVYKGSDETIVKGRVWLTRHFKPGDYGHIDIERISPDGVSVEKSRVFHKPRTLKLIGTRPAYFESALSNSENKGSTFRVTYHQSEDTDNIISCSY